MGNMENSSRRTHQPASFTQPDTRKPQPGGWARTAAQPRGDAEQELQHLLSIRARLAGQRGKNDRHVFHPSKGAGRARLRSRDAT